MTNNSVILRNVISRSKDPNKAKALEIVDDVEKVIMDSCTQAVTGNDLDIKFLADAASYFESRETSDNKTFWANVQSAEGCRRVSRRLVVLCGLVCNLQDRLNWEQTLNTNSKNDVEDYRDAAKSEADRVDELLDQCRNLRVANRHWRTTATVALCTIIAQAICIIFLMS